MTVKKVKDRLDVRHNFLLLSSILKIASKEKKRDLKVRMLKRNDEIERAMLATTTTLFFSLFSSLSCSF